MLVPLFEKFLINYVQNWSQRCMTKESLYDIGETFSSLVFDSRPKSIGLNNWKPKGYSLTGLRLSYRMSAFFKKE